MTTIFSYHATTRPRPTDEQKARAVPLIGFEIEKQDEDLREAESAYRILDDTGWIKERDGSLCAHSGFELVSPVFCIDEDFEKQFKPVLHLINASTNNNGNRPTNADPDENLHDDNREKYDKNEAPRATNCGGHINISHPKYKESEKLAKALTAYYPLFYAMYKNRLNSYYAPAKNTKDKDKYNKYSAFHCKSNGVFEIRIFSAVKNVKQLIWRTDLLRWILQHPTRRPISIIKHILDPKSELNKHLSKVYSPEGIHNLALSYCKLSEAYNNTKPTAAPESDIKQMFNRLRNAYKETAKKDKTTN